MAESIFLQSLGFCKSGLAKFYPPFVSLDLGPMEFGLRPCGVLDFGLKPCGVLDLGPGLCPKFGVLGHGLWIMFVL